MSDLIFSYFLWIKAFHVISVFAWMAGIFYLPRLFVYHADPSIHSQTAETFKIMERKLLKIIMNPAMVLSWIFGGMLLYHSIETGQMKQGWLHTKLLMVVLMTLFHKVCFYHQKQFEKDRNKRSGRYFRILNEIPTLFLAIIVIMVIVRPF